MDDVFIIGFPWHAGAVAKFEITWRKHFGSEPQRALTDSAPLSIIDRKGASLENEVRRG